MESIKELYELYERYVFKYLYGLTLNYHVSEELTQETFFQILKSFYSFRGECHVKTWIYKIARNVYFQWYREKGHTVVHIDDELLNIPEKYGPEELLETKEKNKSIEYALMQTSQKYREILWLRDWQALSYEEIAVLTNRSISWVKVNIHRARLEFKKYYIEKEEY
jgi:RNA polymerase sigma-70 factor, ECF subfamily